jgi:TonB family protein
MNRLQKKCFIASAGFHLLLAVILVVGPAFLSSKSRQDDMRLLDVIPAKLIDAAFSSDGGNPNAKPPPPTPPTPDPPIVQPQVQPRPEPEKAKVREPDPPKDAVTPKPEAESLEMSKEQKPRKPQVSLTPVKRTLKPKETTKPEIDPQAQQFAENRKKAAALIGKTARSLREDLSSSTTIETNYGQGPGGEAYANYAQVVKSIYEHAWTPPDDTASDDAITKVTVTIRNDGTVVSAQILKDSGEVSVDKSVQRTLDRVTFIAPFPEGARDKQRTYKINFNLKAKRLLG